MEMWRLCFDDSEEFIQLFFDRIYQEENALTIEVNGQIVSSLHIIPYQMTFCDDIASVAYIAGACTLPSERKKGYMAELLNESIDIMRHRDYDLTALIPADDPLFEYYRRYGYTELFDYTLEKYQLLETVHKNEFIDISVIDGKPTDDMFDYFDQKLRERQCCILHDRHGFETIVEEINLDEGEVVVARNESSHIVGMAFILPSIDHLYIKELLYDDDSIREQILQQALIHRELKEAHYRTPPQLPDTHRLGMGMVLNRERASRLWLNKNPQYPITAEGLDKMDIQTLSRHLMNYTEKVPYMSLMMD